MSSDLTTLLALVRKPSTILVPVAAVVLLNAVGTVSAQQDDEEVGELARTSTVDLRPFCNWTAAELLGANAPWGGPFAASNIVRGVAFEINGALELASPLPAPGQSRAVGRVRGIPVGRKIAAIHLLHAALAPADEGAVVAEVIVNTADNPPASLPLIYGEHVRAAADTNDIVLDSNTRAVALSTNDASPLPIRWFKTTLLNPFPDKDVESIDFVAGDPQTACVILAVSIGGTADEAEPADSVLPGFDDINKALLNFKAVDATTGRPVESLRVKVGVSQGNVSSSLGSFYTDAKGSCTIPLPGETMTYLHSYMIKDGYVQKSYRWNRRSPTETSSGNNSDGGLTPPTDYLFSAEPAAVLGGIVRDDSGELIPGAKITVQNFVVIRSKKTGEQLSMTGVEVFTDEAGRWRLACLPRNYSQFTLQVEHDDFTTAVFVPDDRRGNVSGIKISMRALLATNAVMTLKRGLGLAGVMTDQRDRPVVGARILIGNSRYRTSSSSREPVTVRTDAKGRFRLPAQARGKVTVTVQAPGFAPEMRELEVTPSSEPLELKLAPGRTIEGHVVDSVGLPIGDVRVSVQEWRDKQTLQWSTRTDGDGYFEWDSAPGDDVRFYFYREGYLNQMMTLSANEAEHLVRLAERPVISGRVVDAETKRPVDEFRVIPGRQYSPGSYSWYDYRNVTGTAGLFSMTLEESGPQMVLKIMAPGYRSFISKPFNATDGDQNLEIALQPGSGVKGIVRMPDGSPVAGAEVAAVGRNSYVQLEHGRFTRMGSRNEVVRTDSAGRFALSEVDELQMIAAVHANGFAEATADQPEAMTNLVLQPWGRIEGVVRVGAQPGASLNLILSHGNPQVHQFSYSYRDYRVTTDAEGRFAMDFVPPGNRLLYRLVPIGRNSQMWSHGTEVEVKPGETAQVTMGGTGRPVIGRAVIKNAGKTVDWTQCNGNIYSVQAIPPPGPGRVVRTRMMSRNFGFALAADGTFRVEDVPAGNYSVNVSVMETEERGNSRITRSIGYARKSVRVPEMPGGRSDEPLDIGDVEVRLNR